MKDVRIYCDVCGQRITQDRTNLRVMTGALRNRAAELDICGGDCIDRLTALIASPAFSTLEGPDARPDPPRRRELRPDPLARAKVNGSPIPA